MNDTFLNTLLQISEKEKQDEGRRSPHTHPRPSSVLFSRPPSSILVSRPPSAAFLNRPLSSNLKKLRRPPSTSTLRPRHLSGDDSHILTRPPSASTIGRPTSVMSLRRNNNIKCNVCTDGFRFPGNVPCFDSYCAQCLEDHILNYKRGTGCDCPLCKTSILLPKSRPRAESAKSMRKSDLNLCNVCQESRLAQYRCNNCEDYFCEKCNKNFIRRMRIDNNFNIATVTDFTGNNDMPILVREDVGGNDYDSLDSVSIGMPEILPKSFGFRCNKHEDEELRYHCTECNTTVCRDCKIVEHEGHPTKSLEDVYEERRHNLSNAIKMANANIRKLHGECAEINSKRLEIDQESRDAITLIENHANEVKKMVDVVAKEMIKRIRTQNTESRGKLQCCRDLVKDKVKVLQELVEEASSLLDDDDALKIVNRGQARVSHLNETDTSPSADRFWRTKFAFQAVELTEESMTEKFGYLQTIMEGLLKEVPSVDLEMQATFNSDKTYKQTTSIAPLSDNTAWVCNGYKNVVHRFDADGNILGTEVLDFDVDDMVDGTADKLFFTEFNGKCIRKLTNKKLSIFARTDVYLRGITVSRDDKLVIACGNDVPVACLRDTAIAKIFVFDMLGKVVKEIVVDTGSKGISLFRICHTINNEYVVSTGISGIYLILGVSGEVRYRYKASMTADGVACDEHGLLYLSACKDDTLYVLSSKGVPLPSTYAMHKPTAVAIDRNDSIWVGDWSKVHLLKYKL